ncbi:peptidase M15 [Bradyrhizobium sp. 33ap4]|uniref:peptidase M15 n=1 Tax=Bradyrhizobium sp. 33ap4 TaxID=3061630 RepID=UPI00292F9132|nr:peptidase M15 [Bradyrhizobium sp. 33ap4]
MRISILIRMIDAVACWAVQQGSDRAFGGYGVMNPRRIATPELCGTVVLAGWLFAWLAGSAGIGNSGAVSIEDLAPSLAANAELADTRQATAVDNVSKVNAEAAMAAESLTGPASDTMAPPQAGVMGNAVANADAAMAVESVPATPPDATATSSEPKSIVVAALPDSSQTLPVETSPVKAATASPPPVSGDTEEAARPLDIFEECLVVDVCIDRYLWALYQRTPKQDTISVQEQRKVTVKKKRKTVTVTRTFTRRVDNDFTWKDPKAAERMGMPMIDYVIGGVDRSFKLKLFHALYAAEQAGLAPGITSAFRDDYRQSIASGLKAASDKSYHGGSFRGGYGHGLAVDVVSVRGATRAERWVSTEALWKWIDARGPDFGIGRPYLDRDPPHVAPIDGKEYAAHRGGTKAQHAEADRKKRDRGAGRVMAKRSKTAKASKGRTI